MNTYESEIGAYDISNEVSKLEAVFAKELTASLSHSYITSLVEKLGGMNQNPMAFIENGKTLHFAVGSEIYGSLIAGYCQWLDLECQKLGHNGSVYFALRDAAPLEAAFTIHPSSMRLNAVGIYANRPILGIDDEIAPEHSKSNGNIQKYLANKGLFSNQKVVWADTGAWGTVIQELKNTSLKDQFLYPFFWYSHNPYIPGYINTLLGEAGLDEKFGEILNDSMECMFPQQYLRPLQISEDSSDVVLLPSNYLAIQWGKAALDGVKAGASVWFGRVSHEQQVNELIKLNKLSQEARQTGSWTGVLPTNTPTWSKGAEFLAEFKPDYIGKGVV